MSEADSLNPDPGTAESNPASFESPAAPGAIVNTARSTAEDTDDPWETVDFPGAIRVDTIPIAASPAQEAPAAEMADLATVVERLQQENRALQQQIAQLGQDLVQQQMEVQLETQTIADSAVSQVAKQSDSPSLEELNSAQESMNRLFQELELSHQANQRQQILVENLTEQLASSQERIALLERECAQAQQRYNEQLQLRLQAEGSNRDLRMRLHRQQQHTLQFKAALEKSLEMQTPYHQAHFLPDAELGEEATDLTPAVESDAVKPLAPPKNSPVQPWSGGRDAAKVELRHPFPDAKPLSLYQEPGDEGPSDETPLTPEESRQFADVISLIFPENKEASSIGSASAPTEPTFDADSLVQAEPSTDAVPEASDAAQPDADDRLWQDLESLIEPATSTPETSPSFGEPLHHPSANSEPAEKLAPAPTPAVAPAKPNAALSSLLDYLGKPVLANPGSSLPLHSLQTESPDDGQSPSPVLYPARPPKKRSSLAAVDLPMFPRLGNPDGSRPVG